MEIYQSPAAMVQTSAGQLKESIRYMVRLQRDYQLSDEAFWVIFNNRVLLNEEIDIHEFLNDSTVPFARA